MAEILFGPEGAVQALIFSLPRLRPIKETEVLSSGDINRTLAPNRLYALVKAKS